MEQEDDGRYMCEASNGVGSPLSTVVKLTVHGKLFLCCLENITSSTHNFVIKIPKEKAIK